MIVGDLDMSDGYTFRRTAQHEIFRACAFFLSGSCSPRAECIDIFATQVLTNQRSGRQKDQDSLEVQRRIRTSAQTPVDALRLHGHFLDDVRRRNLDNHK